MLRRKALPAGPDGGISQQANLDVPKILQQLTDHAGVRFGGSKPWDIRVNDPSVFRRILTEGSLGFGEAYMDGLWDADELDALFTRLLRSDVDREIGAWVRTRLVREVIRQSLFNLQTRQRVFQVAEHHYDIGNDVFRAMLDSSMSYSCGYWLHATNLEQAQHDKLDLICRKLELRRGDRLLDIGCGWGGLAEHAARNYGADVTGITISKEQQWLAQGRCRGLPVQIKLMDYRDIQGEFDRIVSVGMFEHVGLKNYPDFFDTVSRVMAKDGLFLLHSIGLDKTSRVLDPWIGKYIFPNGKLPSARELTRAIEGKFLIEDWHNFGQDYDKTLMAWWANFDKAWPQLASKYGPRFYRMWKYYLMSCAGLFRSRQGQLWQLVMCKRDRTSVYRSIR